MHWRRAIFMYAWNLWQQSTRQSEPRHPRVSAATQPPPTATTQPRPSHNPATITNGRQQYQRPTTYCSHALEFTLDTCPMACRMRLHVEHACPAEWNCVGVRRGSIRWSRDGSRGSQGGGQESEAKPSKGPSVRVSCQSRRGTATTSQRAASNPAYLVHQEPCP